MTTKFDPRKHLTDLRGRDYLEVKWRIAWFRSEHPAGRIDTNVTSYDPLIVKAVIFTADEVLATGHGSADAAGRKVVWTGREIEKAETAAIGRALAHAGYGTQFTGDDEGEHLADSPVEKPAKSAAPAKKNAAPVNIVDWMVEEDHATNIHNARSIFKNLKLAPLMNTGDVEAAQARVIRYRELRDEGMDAEFATVHAIKGGE